MSSTNTITKHDLQRIEKSIKEVIEASKTDGIQSEYIELLDRIVDELSNLRITVEFDHERRLQAIENFLQDEY